ALETRRVLELGSLLPAAHTECARRCRELIRRELASTFGRARLDALVSPTLPRASIGIDEMTAAGLPRFLPYVFPANLSGQPPLPVPCGFTADGRPIGLHLVGAPFAEATVLRIGHAYQQVTEWHRRRPQLAASIAEASLAMPPGGRAGSAGAAVS